MRSDSARLFSQIGVFTDPGSIERDLHAGAVQLDAQRIAHGLDRVLGGRVGGAEAKGHAPADGGDEHDPPAGAAKRRQQRAGDGDLTEQVDVEQAAQVGFGDQLERTAEPDAGVVHERVQRPGRLLLDQYTSALDLRGVRHVELQGVYPPGERCPCELLADSHVAHAGEHRPAGRREGDRARPPNPARGARDQRSGHPCDVTPDRARPVEAPAISGNLGSGTMVGTVPAPRFAHRRIAATALAIALTGALGGCGSTVAVRPAAHLSDIADQAVANIPAGCPETVLGTVGTVLAKVYREGVASERTLSAEHLIAGSTALRRAVESGDAPAATAAARALLATGHMTNLRVTRGSKTLVNLGGAALAPISGTIRSAGGAPLATYLTSVWADSGFVSEADGVAQGQVAIRSHNRSIGGSLALATGPLGNEGTLTRNHVVYQFTSFPAEAYPSGSVRIYALIPLSATATLCGASSEDTLVEHARPRRQPDLRGRGRPADARADPTRAA